MLAFPLSCIARPEWFIMIALDDYRKKLGDKARSKTDAELQSILTLQEKLADVLFDKWVNKLNNQKLQHKCDTIGGLNECGE